jgi:hypothetical protein
VFKKKIFSTGGFRRLSAQSSSALAAFHRAMPAEQRDDEWRAVDAVLRAHELHARERRPYY